MKTSSCLSHCLLIGLLVFSTASAQSFFQSIGDRFKTLTGQSQSASEEPQVSVPIYTEDLLSTEAPIPQLQIVQDLSQQRLPNNQEPLIEHPDVLASRAPYTAGDFSQLSQLSQLQDSQRRLPTTAPLIEHPDVLEQPGQIQQVSQYVQSSGQRLQETSSINRPQISPPRWRERPQVQPPRYTQISQEGNRLQVEPQVEELVDIPPQSGQLTRTVTPIVVPEPSYQRPALIQRPQVQPPKYAQTAQLQEAPCCTSPVLSQQLQQVLTKLDALNSKIDGLQTDLAKAQEKIQSQTETIEQLRNVQGDCSQQGKTGANLQEFARIPTIQPTRPSQVERLTAAQVITPAPQVPAFVKG